MRSSTSSSERIPPPTGWGTTWGVALVLSAAVLVLLESTLRGRGHHPTVSDDTVTWVDARRSVDDDARVVAFVGGSRMQLAVSLQTLRALVPDRRGVELAIRATPSLGVLDDLAGDARFHGIVIVDVTSWELADPGTFDRAASWVHANHPLWRMPGAVLNRWLSLPVQEHLTTLALGGRQILVSALDSHSLPGPGWTRMTRDRVRVGNYGVASPVSLEARERRTAGAIMEWPLDSWRQHLSRIERAVAAIRQRGGNVVFLHPPISGRVRARSDELYPKAQYWDAFARATSAVTIHFADVPGMADLRCADGVHLDGSQQEAFTRALVDALRGRHVL